MPTPVPPDVELVVVDYLRRPASALVALVDDRVYTVVPRDAVFPLLRVVRYSGGPVRSAPLHLLSIGLQLDAFGGSKADARRLLDAARLELASIELATHTGAVVTGAQFGEVRYLPDSDYNPPKPRYASDVSILAHP